ncbi:type II secretion system protein N [Noviherbaspirillum sp. UKPF54]|uniref:type II secretion system protein N n=1 Tax=Noviherbaspirillum sp. UKPF54 TaxID=2601898 RepID=UPI0011B1B837|nr:type II secretion system protein N [Noviherbaspirillum sp. UKPF54]QDZ29141.1 hypothetical protein FAY22_14955 [Noviherbaspirillum sp. UKPF54]
MKRVPLIVSFLLFIALCASIAYWGLQLFKPPTRPVAAPPRVARADISPDEAAALFGGRPGKVAAASNYQLKGVILSGTENDSVAILSADGKPAQAVGVGTEVVPGVTVKEVHREYVLLSDAGAVKRVDLPENAKMQVNIASAAPTTGVQEGAGIAPSPARNPPTPQTTQAPAATPAPAPAAASGQTPGVRSPLLPPPAPQALQQGQTQPLSQTAPAVPARVVVPSPAAQTATSPATPAPAVVPAPAPTTAAPAGMPPVTQPAPAPATGSSGEMLPPPALQSR